MVDSASFVYIKIRRKIFFIFILKKKKGKGKKSYEFLLKNQKCVIIQGVRAKTLKILFMWNLSDNTFIMTEKKKKHK